jgi:hypothetical protein
MDMTPGTTKRLPACRFSHLARPDGSAVPHELTQRFTTVAIAKEFIDKFNKDQNEKPD